MQMFFRGLAVTLLGVLLGTVGCDQSTEKKDKTQSNLKPLANRVVAVSYPLQYLTKRIVGDSINVDMPVPTGGDPQNWRPTRDAITDMQSADLIIANGTGATYANWLTTVSLPESKICFSATRGLSLSDYIAVENVQVVHSHGPEGEHSHATMVARSWLDPAIAKQQAVYIAKQLNRVYPDLRDQFDRNLKTLSTALDQLSELMNASQPQNGPTIISANHRSKFFTRAIGITDRHLVWTDLPTAEQAESDLKKILGELPDPKPNLILFGSDQPSNELLQQLTAVCLTPVSIDLIDQEPATGDYLTEMKANVERFTAALKRD